MRVQVVRNGQLGRKVWGILKRLIAGFYPVMIIVAGFLLLVHYLLGNSEAKAASSARYDIRVCNTLLLNEDNDGKEAPQPPRPRIEDMVELPLQEIQDVPPVTQEIPPPKVTEIPVDVWKWNVTINQKIDPKHSVN